jgi:transcriptional regulator with XRE-family HTH domain
VDYGFPLGNPITVPTLQQQFGTVIRRLRKDLGMGQEKLADTAGLHRTHVSMLERGLRMPTLLVVQKLARALNTPMSGLMAELEAEEEAGDVDIAPPKTCREPKA